MLLDKDAGAEHPSFRGGPGVIAYTDLLATQGYTETAGDAANRDRYSVRAVANSVGESDDEPQTDDGGDGE